MSQKDHCEVKYFRYCSVHQNPRKILAKFTKAGLTFSPLAGLYFFCRSAVLPCKALVQDFIACVTAIYKRKKKMASMSQNLMQCLEKTMEIALSTNSARDLCVRQLTTTFDRRQKEDFCGIIL